MNKLIQLVGILVFFSCNSNNNSCVQSMEFKRFDTASPDEVKMVIKIDNSEIFQKVISGEFISFKLSCLYEGNLKNKFHGDNIDIISDNTFSFYFGTTYFYTQNRTLKKASQNIINEVEVTIEFNNGELLTLCNCK
ncbi:hypothetical protein [Echinicola sp. 20G]|uniref:hypothetical protein n=1 Tax=Echinicola sp. 20G TaxID=2781961 RepID=UPI0019100E0F|nr:hypothetical protein [Echinicola sp. 20G]